MLQETMGNRVPDAYVDFSAMPQTKAATFTFHALCAIGKTLSQRIALTGQTDHGMIMTLM